MLSTPDQSDCYLSFPEPFKVADERIFRRKERFSSFIMSTKADIQTIASFLTFENDLLTERLIFEIICEIIESYPRECVAFKSGDRKMILKLLDICPKAAHYLSSFAADEDKELLLIHYLCLMENPDSKVLQRLVEIHPASVGVCGKIGALQVTPFELILMKSEINYDLALYLLTSCSQVAR
jgi:hypothetical protein